jgi:hypothetical protein
LRASESGEADRRDDTAPSPTAEFEAHPRSGGGPTSDLSPGSKPKADPGRKPAGGAPAGGGAPQIGLSVRRPEGRVVRIHVFIQSLSHVYEQEVRSLTAPTTPSPRARRLASGPQLYVLNRAGWLELRQTAKVDDQIHPSLPTSRSVVRSRKRPRLRDLLRRIRRDDLALASVCLAEDTGFLAQP